MKTLKTRIHPVTIILALAIAGLAVYMNYSRKLQSQPGEMTGPRKMARPSQVRDDGLGATLSAGNKGQGQMVIGFQPNAAASRLALLGCFPGDVLVSCNGGPVSATTVRKAIEEMEKTGKPVVLVVYREGKKIELKTTKLPDVPPIFEKMGRNPRAHQTRGGEQPGR